LADHGKDVEGGGWQVQHIA